MFDSNNIVILQQLVLNYCLISVIQTFIVINYLWGFIISYYCNMNLYNLGLIYLSFHFYDIHAYLAVLQMQFLNAARRSRICFAVLLCGFCSAARRFEPKKRELRELQNSFAGSCFAGSTRDALRAEGCPKNKRATLDVVQSKTTYFKMSETCFTWIHIFLSFRCGVQRINGRQLWHH